MQRGVANFAHYFRQGKTFFPDHDRSLANNYFCGCLIVSFDDDAIISKHPNESSKWPTQKVHKNGIFTIHNQLQA